MTRLARLLAALACFLAATMNPAMAAGDEAAIVRGGRLYDQWDRELKDHPPATPHPAFPAKRGNVAAADTWRCKECHGWDYKGRHGIAGIRARQGAEPAAIVAVLKDATHRYDKFLGEGDLADLAAFVSRGQADMAALAEAARRAKGEAAAQEKYYGTICAACHGADGGGLREIAPLGELARRAPAEVLHVMQNGHPGQVMPALRALGADFAARLLAYLQTLPAASTAVSVAHGGRLYDDWQIEAGAQRPALPHPAYPPTAYYAGDARMSWRCVACHGWDYLGSQGANAAGRHATGIKGVRAMAGAEPARIVAVLKDATHRYDAVLKERDLMDIANFVGRGQVDMDAAIERKSGRARGDAARAAPHFRTLCAACHGLDGRRLNTAAPLGRTARAKPWESLHKILNGHPDEKMPALRELDAQLPADLLAYLQGLPEGRTAEEATAGKAK